MATNHDSSGDDGRLVGAVRRLAGRLHDDEGGAVVMLAVAACLILFMIGLVMYDAGYVARDKLDAQMAADTAAYSQASVKARAMNHIAFANVAKRTTVGIRNAYIGGYRAYRRWRDQKCSSCGPFNIPDCITCATNGIVLGIEQIEFTLFSGIMRLPFAGPGDTLTEYLEALDDYQEQMKQYAPYWAASEAIIRGVRNGANFITTYPMPDTADYGPLPVEKDSGFSAHREGCLAPMPSINPITPNTMLEFDANIDYIVDESDQWPFPENITDVPPGYFETAITEACTRWNRWGPDADPGTPMHLSAEGSSGDDYMKKGNFIFSFRQNNAYGGPLRDKFDFLPAGDQNTTSYTTPGGGMWSMARGEVYFPGGNKPTTIQDGRNDIWMFHPGWIGKMRPVLFPGETLPVEPSQMWQEAQTPYATLGPLFGVDQANVPTSTLYMREVMFGFDGDIGGREVMDGNPK